MKTKGIVYDLDGTIISTIGLHERCWKRAARHFGVILSPQMLLDQKGMTEDAAAIMMLGKKYSDIGSSFVRIKRMFVLESVKEVKPYKSFIKTMGMLEKKGLKVWVCTSVFKKFVKEVYSHFKELNPLWHKTIAREDYKEGKPSAEPILLTLKKMRLKPSETIYVGDAYSDYKASKNAGCRFVYFCRGERDKRIPKNVPGIRLHTEIIKLL